jgi:hypothetical protein
VGLLNAAKNERAVSWIRFMQQGKQEEVALPTDTLGVSTATRPGFATVRFPAPKTAGPFVPPPPLDAV